MAYQKFNSRKYRMRYLPIISLLLLTAMLPAHTYYSASDFLNDLKKAGNKVSDGFKSIPDFFKDRFSDTQATRALDFAARMAAYESALQVATGVLNTSKELAGGTLVAARETAKAGVTAAEGFLHGVEDTSAGVLQVSGDAAKGVLEGAKQSTVGVLQGTTWVANQTLNQFDITRIHYDGTLQDLAKGSLGSVEA